MNRGTLLALAFTLAACGELAEDTGKSGDTAPPNVVDGDGDGYAETEDCDDGNNTVHPGADEVCDELDNDCDGEIDEDAGETWYADLDGDQYGDSANSMLSCDVPDDYVSNGEDCDDDDATQFPGAYEACNGEDDDCDGEIDEDVVVGNGRWYADADGDGWATEDEVSEQCEQPDGYLGADALGDCDDDDDGVHPDADELCDGIDNDCDGDVDEATAIDVRTWVLDADGDGWSEGMTSTESCDQPSGYVDAEAIGDCDDTDAEINPDAYELCDGVDNDCDGSTDEDDAVDVSTWYADADGDGHGSAASGSVQACEQPKGYVSSAADCDDADAGSHADAAEICDGLDNDCDGSTDEASAVDAVTWYVDADGDGYGDDTTATVSCDAPTGTIDVGSDCDDADAAIHPAASEDCDGVDNDCDGDVDEGAIELTTWYIDYDSDGYGSDAYTVESCQQPTGYVAVDTDCDDTDPASYPGAPEVWYDGTDQDCDELSDYDQDYDGYDSEDYGGEDCDDEDATVNPLAVETYYDGVDQDCDDHSDYDVDWDGYDSAGHWGTDCDDNDPDVYPGAPEVDAGIDNDCDGTAVALPVASAIYDTDISDLEHCTSLYLDGSASYDPDGTTLTYEWTVLTVPTGSLIDDSDFDDAGSATPVITPDIDGDFEFQLTVTDMDDLTDTDTVFVTITARATNTAPVADAGSDAILTETVTCTLDGYGYKCDDCSAQTYTLDSSATYDDDDEALDYLWSVTSGSATLSDEYAANPSATLEGPTCTYGATTTETFEFELEVTDCFGDVSTDTVTITYECTGA